MISATWPHIPTGALIEDLGRWLVRDPPPVAQHGAVGDGRARGAGSPWLSTMASGEGAVKRLDRLLRRIEVLEGIDPTTLALARKAAAESE